MKKVKVYVPGKNWNRRKHYWWRYLLVLILGQALIIPELGLGIAGFATSVKTDLLLNLIPEDYRDAILVESQSLLSFGIKLGTSNLDIKSLNDLKQSGLVDAEVLVSKLTAEGQPLEKYKSIITDELYATNFDAIPDYLMNTVEVGPLLSTMDLPLPAALTNMLMYEVPVAYIGTQDETNKITIEVGEVYTVDDAVIVLPEKASNREYTVAIKGDTAKAILKEGEEPVQEGDGEPTEPVVTSDYLTLTQNEDEEYVLTGTAVGETELTVKQDSEAEGAAEATLTVEVVAAGTKSISKSFIKREGEEPVQEGDGEPTEPVVTPTCEQHVDEHGTDGFNHPNGYCDVCGKIIRTPLTINGIIANLGNLLGSLTGLKINDLMGLVSSFMGGGESEVDLDAEPLHDITPTVDPSTITSIADLFGNLGLMDLIGIFTGGGFMSLLGPVKVSLLLGDTSGDPFLSKIGDKTFSELTSEGIDLTELIGGVALSSLVPSLASAEGLIGLVADCCLVHSPDYVSTKTYDTGAIVAYSGSYYKAIADGITGEWDATKWEAYTDEPQSATEMFEDLTIGAALGIPENANKADWPAILWALKDEKLSGGELATHMEQKTIGDLLGFPEDVANFSAEKKIETWGADWETNAEYLAKVSEYDTWADENLILSKLATCTLSGDAISAAMSNVVDDLLDTMTLSEVGIDMFTDNTQTALSGIWNLLIDPEMTPDTTVVDAATYATADGTHKLFVKVTEASGSYYKEATEFASDTTYYYVSKSAVDVAKEAGVGTLTSAMGSVGFKMSYTTIRKLVEYGLLDIDSATLEKEFKKPSGIDTTDPTNPKISYTTGKKIGDYTLPELVQELSNLDA